MQEPAIPHNDKAHDSPVYQLPNEILFLIFSLTVEREWANRSAADLGRLSIVRRGLSIKENLSVKNVSQVCHRWRLVALSDPLLWSFWSLYDMKRPRWFEELERRSLTAPLIVRVIDSPVSPIDHILARQSSRIRVLEYGLWQGQYRDRTPLLKRPFIKYPAPSLESLTFFFQRTTDVSVQKDPTGLFGGIAPLLRELRLDGGIIDLATPVFSQITHLTMLEVNIDRFSPRPRNVRQALASLKSLKELVIVDSSLFHHASDSPVGDKVILPQLRRLDISGTLWQCSNFLDRCLLGLPPDCSFSLDCINSNWYGSSFSYGNDTTIVTDFVKEFAPNHAGLFNEPWTLSLFPNTCSLAHRAMDKSSPSFSFTLRKDPNIISHYIEDEAPIIFFPLLSRLIHLSFILSPNLDQEWPATAKLVKRLLKPAHLVNRLAVSGRLSYETVISLLKITEPFPGGSLSYLPSLRRLQVRAVDLGDDIWVLGDVVRHGARRGRPIDVIDVLGREGLALLEREFRDLQGIHIRVVE